MSLKNKILGGALAAAFCGLFATNVSAVMRYDLRFADGTKSKVIDTPGTHQLNLYAVIDQGTGGYADDSITGGFVNVYSGNTLGGAMTAGSGITNFTLGPAVFAGQSLVGSGGDLRTNPNYNIFAVEAGTTDNTAPESSKDGILDWGSDQSFHGALAFASPNQALKTYEKDGVILNPSVNASVKYAFAPPLVPGGAVGAASALVPNAWEVLLGTYTVQVNGVVAGGTTSFTPWTYHRTRLSSGAGTATDGMSYNQDGAAAVPGRATVRFQDVPSLFSGVSIQGVIIPEPSTVVMCGLAAIGSIFALRRRAKS